MGSVPTQLHRLFHPVGSGAAAVRDRGAQRRPRRRRIRRIRAIRPMTPPATATLSRTSTIATMTSNPISAPTISILLFCRGTSPRVWTGFLNERGGRVCVRPFPKQGTDKDEGHAVYEKSACPHP